MPEPRLHLAPRRKGLEEPEPSRGWKRTRTQMKPGASNRFQHRRTPEPRSPPGRQRHPTRGSRRSKPPTSVPAGPTRSRSAFPPPSAPSSPRRHPTDSPAAPPDRPPAEGTRRRAGCPPSHPPPPRARLPSSTSPMASRSTATHGSGAAKRGFRKTSRAPYAQSTRMASAFASRNSALQTPRLLTAQLPGTANPRRGPRRPWRARPIPRISDGNWSSTAADSWRRASPRTT